jgi:putative SOS response-associated peptidase YedK
VPYYVSLPGTKLFSIAGLYATFRDRSTDQRYPTCTVLTTRANNLMEKIHNSKKRMPVIIPREYEQDWLNPSLSQEDVLALCQPIDGKLMEGHTISKLITNKKEETDVPRVLEPETYQEVMDADQGITPVSAKPAATLKKKSSKEAGKDNAAQTELF